MGLTWALVPGEDEFGATREVLDDLRGLGVPTEPHDLLVLGLWNDICLLATHVAEEGVGLVVRHVDTGRIDHA